MAVSIALLAFSAAIAWLIHRFHLRDAASWEAIRPVLPVWALCILFSTVSLLGALLGVASMRDTASATPITSAAIIEGLPNLDGVIVSGVVNESNPAAHAGHVARLEESMLWSPIGLRIDLVEGAVTISNDNYRARGWPVDPREIGYLDRGMPVTVVGFISRNYNQPPDAPTPLRAEIIHAGSPADFARQARDSLFLAKVMVIMSALVTLVIIAMPIPAFHRAWRRHRAQTA
jgi:hypothetical protein